VIGATLASPGAVLAANSGACTSGTAANYKASWAYNATTTPYWVKAVAGDATVQMIYGCAGGGAPGVMSLVPVANLQEYAIKAGDPSLPPGPCGTYGGYDPRKYIVQIGFWADSSGVPYLFWTPDSSGCGASQTATWYTRSGYSPGRVFPGHAYRFRITLASSNTWSLCVMDRTLGESYRCGNVANTWITSTGSHNGLGGNVAWWGYETNNTSASMGSIQGSPYIDIHWMQWLTTQTGAQWMVENTVQCSWYLLGHYVCSTLNTAPGYGSDTLRVYTKPY
jgi:hypothetical protein